MIKLIYKNSKAFFSQCLAVLNILAFILSSLVISVPGSAQPVLNLPSPGSMVKLTPHFYPPIIKGMRINLENPFQLDFIVDTGEERIADEALRQETGKLVKYFLASLTIPEDELWVNLSPYEENRIISDDFIKTEMGRELLAQDYLLKQLTASLIYPEGELGKEFWERVKAKAGLPLDSKKIALDTFNKIWIVPEKAAVFVHEQSVFVTESYLKVMLEEDYVAMAHQKAIAESHAPAGDVAMVHHSSLTSNIVREVLIPEIEKEVNEGRHFAPLRQIYHSMILATWYKNNLKRSILSQAYADKNLIEGIEIEDTGIKEEIYNRYLEAFKKGAYDYIKEEYDPITQDVVQRKYFSGGIVLKNDIGEETAGMSPTERLAQIHNEFSGAPVLAAVNLDRASLSNNDPVRGAFKLENNVYRFDEIDLDQFRFILDRWFSSNEERKFERDVWIAKALADNVRIVVLRDEKGSLTGMAILHPSKSMDFSDIYTLDLIEISASNRGAGVGTIFIGAILNWVVQQFPGRSSSFDVMYLRPDEDGRISSGESLESYYRKRGFGDIRALMESFVPDQDLGNPLYLSINGARASRLIESYREKQTAFKPQATQLELPFGPQQLDLPFDKQTDRAPLSSHTQMLGNRETADIFLEGSKATNFHFLAQANDIVRGDREDDLFPLGFDIFTPAVKRIRQDGDISADLWQEIQETLILLELKTNKKFGDSQNPLFLSVRSSPQFSMPGQLDTILNLGMTEQTIQVLLSDPKNDPAAVWNAYRRFIGHFGYLIMGVEQTQDEDVFLIELERYLASRNKSSEFELTAEEQKELIEKYKTMIKAFTGQDFPKDDVYKQLRMALISVASSWDREEVKDFREGESISEDAGYALIVQEMKFGNLNENSGAGVVFSRDPQTGKKELKADFMLKKQGTAIVSGKTQAQDPQALLAERFPEAYQQLTDVAKILERLMGRVVDIEFTVENGKLYILQVRPAQMSVMAEIQTLKDFLEEGIIDRIKRVNRLTELQQRIEKRPIYKVRESVKREIVFTGSVASPGALKGKIVFNVKEFERMAKKSEPVILVITEHRRKDFLTVLKYSGYQVGFIADYGSDLSHEIQMARKRVVPAVVEKEGKLKINENHFTVNGRRFEAGMEVLLDGNNGTVSLTEETNLFDEDKTIMRASFDMNVAKFRRQFLAEGGFLTKEGKGEPQFTSEGNYELRDPQGRIKDEFTFTRLLDLNWQAWREFTEAESKERAAPDDLILQKDTYVKNLRKMFLHELLRERGNMDGLTAEEVESVYDDYLFSKGNVAYKASVVMEKEISIQDWYLNKEGIQQQVINEAQEAMGENVHLVVDSYLRINEAGEEKKVIVVLKPEKTENPIDVFSVFQAESAQLLESPPNEYGTPVSNMLQPTSDGRGISFKLGDYTVKDKDGRIQTVSNDYWSPESIQRRLDGMMVVVKDMFGENVKLRTEQRELRGHQRLGRGLVFYNAWITIEGNVEQGLLVKESVKPVLMTVSMDETSVGRTNETRDSLSRLIEKVPGLSISEYQYSYPTRYGGNMINRNRYVFVIKQKIPTADDERQVKLKQIKDYAYNTSGKMRDYLYQSGGITTVYFPLLGLQPNTPQNISERIIKNDGEVFLKQREYLEKGISLVLDELSQRGINKQETDDENSNANIEIYNNIDPLVDPFREVDQPLQNNHFIVGLPHGAGQRINNFYKRTILISLSMILSIGQRGTMNPKEIEAVGKAVADIKKTAYDKTTTIEESIESLNDRASLDKVGGIDLNPYNWKINDGGIKMDFNIPADADRFYSNPTGLVPTIINIVPIQSLPLFLGLVSEQTAPPQLSKK